MESGDLQEGWPIFFLNFLFHFILITEFSYFVDENSKTKHNVSQKLEIYSVAHIKFIKYNGIRCDFEK